MRSRRTTLEGDVDGNVCPPLELLDQVDRLVDQLNEVRVDALGCEGLRGYLRRCSQITNRFEYLSGRALAALDTIGDGGTVDWIKNELKQSGGAAAERLLVARAMEAHPKTAALLSIGEISYEQAAVVARSTSEVAPADADRVEARLLPAMEMEPGRLRLWAKGVVAEIDGQALRRDARRAWAKRSLHMGPDIDGVASICGHLTSEAAAHWRASTEPYMRPSGPDDERSADQRFHDAALQVMRGAVAGEPGNGRRPHVVVTAPLSALLGEDGPPALLQGIVPISPEELDQCLCEGDLTVLLKDARGNIAYQGKRARRFSPAKRRAIITNNPICVWPGCGRPAVDCDIHHVDEVSQGGETTVDNGAPGCWVHHPKLHREGWALLPNGDGTFHPVPPGHADNPKAGLSPEDYMRRRMRAISERKKGRRKATPPVGALTPPVGALAPPSLTLRSPRPRPRTTPGQHLRRPDVGPCEAKARRAAD
jgi:hypothetical protein